MRFSGAMAALALLVSAGLLVGCSPGSPSGGKAAAVPGAAAAIARPAPSSGAPVSKDPPKARAGTRPFVSTPDEAGAFAFARAYFAELDRAFATGDVTALALFREPLCSCIRMERHIADWYRGGGRLVGAHHTLQGIRAGAHGPLFYEIGILYEAAAVTNHQPGRPVSVTPPLTAILVMDLVRHDTRWLLRDARIRVLPE